MRLKSKCFYFLLPSLLLKCSCSATFPVRTASDFVEENLRVRVRRQDGYVYNKPSVSFDLPQSTPAPTQAPNVDRTLTQQMYYAYPVPASGDTVNIGQTAGTTVTAAPAAPTGGGGYNYKSSTTGNAGYNYGVSSSGGQDNTGYQVTNTGSQISVTSTQTATSTGTSQAGSGYGYKSPSPTLFPILQGSSDVSTSAPKYLPPIAGGIGGGTATGGSVGVSVTSGSGQVTGTSTSVQTGLAGTPSDTYLPPLGTSGPTVTLTSTSSQTNIGASVSVPSSAYLPPNTSSPPSPAPTPGSPSPQPVPALPATYIPPSTYIPASGPNSGPVSTYIPPSGPNSGPVSSPATSYLPPSFF